MQVTTYMQSSRRTRSRPLPARQRLLDAAARVFARDGLAGATTREIAREAGVNEVTLFRHFQTKERLIQAVVGQTFAASSAPAEKVMLPTTTNLAADLADYARRYEKLLAENLPLVRTLIGEIHHHRECERHAIHGIFQPLRTALLDRLEKAKADGVLAKHVRPVVVADLLKAMIFTGVLRRASPALAPSEYSTDDYTAAAIDLLVRGIAAPTKK